MLRLELISEEDHSRIFGNIQAILPLHEGMHFNMYMYVCMYVCMHACALYFCVCVCGSLKCWHLSVIVNIFVHYS